MTQPSSSSGSDGIEFAARIIGALGQLMNEYHSRDLAVQTAVSDLTMSADSLGLNITDLQHIDLVTQTHGDLARFLPRLAESLRNSSLEEQSLAGSLTLRSLQDVLLRPNPVGDSEIMENDLDNITNPGEMDLF